MVISGYLRATEYEKGWEFYAHEPLFWVKMILTAVWGASSLFPTIKIIQRTVQIVNAKSGKGDFPAPMSEKLAKRMTKIINGELLALLSIPLAASLMARGVGHIDSFPWQLGAGAFALTFAGLGFTYVTEALTWTED